MKAADEVVYNLILYINIYFLIVSFINFFTVKAIKRLKFRFNGKNSGKSNPVDKDKVSVIIPMRNEEENAAECLESVKTQSYKNIEIIAINDQSFDKTGEILEHYTQLLPPLRVIHSKKKPEGWTGKNWAVYQGALAAKGEYLVFLDADTRIAEDAITSSINLLKKEKINLLSCVPTQITATLGEFLLVPDCMNWAVLGFIPHALTYKLNLKSFLNQFVVYGCGQFMVAKKKIYDMIGGHKSIKSKLMDDFSLARLFKDNGHHNIMAVDAGRQVICRMYKGWKEAFNGFTRSFAFAYILPSFIYIIIGMVIVFSQILPFILVFSDKRYFNILMLIVFIKILTTIKGNLPVLKSILFHPLQMTALGLVLINSQIARHKNSLTWKGRSV